MNYKMLLLIVWLIAHGGCVANAEVNSEKNNETAHSAWEKAISLAKQRNAGNTCEVEAYESSILSELGTAMKSSPHLKKEVANGKSTSAKAIRKALAGNLMLFDLIGQMSTPKQVAEAMVGSVWYLKHGGVMGSYSILHIGKSNVREFVVDPDKYKRHKVIWAYRFNARTRELTLSNGVTSRRYKVEKTRLNNQVGAYELTSTNAKRVGYSNEPDDCSA
jgi:hypothetical protein